MKKQFLWAALAAVTLLTSCSNNDEPNQEKQTTEVTFVIGGVDSRTTTTGNEGNYTTVFNVGDKVGIYATGGGTAENIMFTVEGSDTEQTLSGKISYTEGTETTFNAYYPYKETATSFTVGNQSNGIDNFDLMTASAKLTQGNTVNLTFEHKLAMVEVQVTGSIGELAETLTLKNIKPTVTYSGTTGEVGEASGEATDIQMYRIDKESNTYVVLVPAQTISANTETFITEIGTKTYVFKPNKDINLTANNIARYKVTIGEGQAEMTTVSAINFTNWVASTLDSDTFTAEEVVEPAIELISVANGTINESTTLTDVTNRTSISEEGWYALKETNITSIIEKTQENLFHLKSVSSEGWNKRCLIYRVAANKIENSTNKVFTLKFLAKASASGNLRIVVSDTNNSKFFDVNSGQAPNRYLTISNTEFTENYSTVTVNFQKYSTTNNTAPNVDSTNDDLDDIIVAITPGKDDIDFFIKDITLIEAKE